MWKGSAGPWCENSRPYTPPRNNGWKNCAGCGRKLKPEFEFCPSCAVTIGTLKRVVDQKKASCSCGNYLEDDFQYCPKCKTPVDKSHLNIPACVCGIIIEPNAKFCVGCGKSCKA